MAVRDGWVLSLVAGIFAFVAGSPVRGGEDAKAQWDQAAATSVPRQPRCGVVQLRLGARGEGFGNFMRELSQPAVFWAGETGPSPNSDEKLPTEFETKMLAQVKSRVANWDALETSPFQLMYDFDEPKKKESRNRVCDERPRAFARRPVS